MKALALLIVVAACGGQEQAAVVVKPPAPTAAKLPSTPGELGPSLVKIDNTFPKQPGEVSDGTQLADVDGCATCHPDAAAQWGQSAHSFASFGNPIYRVNVELARTQLSKEASRHCGGCHDMPLMLDGLMTGDAKIPAADLRAHTGVSCRLCHGIESTSKDGNGSYVWSRKPMDAPELGNAASMAAHKAQVAVKKLGTELCVGCHRGFISADMQMPVHLTGLDESGMWRNSAWAGNGMGRVDKVEKQDCISCHMEKEDASKEEYGAHDGKLASHRFLGGHTWMAAMRGDGDHLRRLQAKLEGAASVDIMPRELGTVDVVVRNLLVGHRFPGGVLDIQDTWLEVEVHDATGKRLAASGLAHETDPKDDDAHTLRTLVVDAKGEVLEQHQMAEMRTQIATQTLAAREAQAIRYTFAVPKGAAMPLAVTARLRHRSRTLQMQAEVCRAAKTDEGKQFIAGAKGARDVVLDPCKAQPITLIAETTEEIGEGAHERSTRPMWEREYEHGMALTSTISERLEEARAVLESALAKAPAGRERAMVLVQLSWVASRQGRVEDALALVAEARTLLPAPGPAVLDAIAADALARVWRWDDAIAPAKACTERAPGNSAAWVMLARVYGSAHQDENALIAATSGLALVPRDPDLLRSQATALAALHRPEAAAALAAYDRFRSPDNSAELRIECAGAHSRCAREREQGHTHVMR